MLRDLRLRDALIDLIEEFKHNIATARAENERLTKERDEALARVKHMEGFDCCTCGPCAIHGTAKRDEAKAALTPTCRKCGGTMQPGHALGQTYTSGASDDLGGDAQTMSAGGPGALIDCRKCEDCGWSVTADPTAQEAEPVPVAWGESYDGGAFFNTVSLTKTKHHTYPLYAHPPQPSVSVAEAAKLADAMEACDWSGSPIGNKMILKAAVKALRAREASEREKLK